MKKYIICLLSALLILLSGNTYSQEIAERKVEKEFSPSPENLQINSKFGNVEILSSDEDQLVVKAHLWVESNNLSKAENLLEKMDVEIFQDGDKVIVNSVFSNMNASGNKTEFHIDFTIYAPPQININLANRYGSAFIEESTGQVNIDFAHGNLKIDELLRGKEKPLNQLNLAYASASISETGWLKVDISNSKLSVDEADALIILSQYSGISIDECRSIVTDSKYDSYKIEEVDNYSGQHKYSNLSIDELFSKFELESEYSTIKVDEIGSNFNEINIDNSRGACRMTINENASFTFNAEAHRGDISISGIDNIDKKIETLDKYLTGSHGNPAGATVNIKTKDGTVKINLD